MEKLEGVRVGRDVRYQGEREGCWAVLGEGGGAMKMAFSVLARVGVRIERVAMRREREGSFGMSMVM